MIEKILKAVVINARGDISVNNIGESDRLAVETGETQRVTLVMTGLEFTDYEKRFATILRQTINRGIDEMDKVRDGFDELEEMLVIPGYYIEERRHINGLDFRPENRCCSHSKAHYLVAMASR